MPESNPTARERAERIYSRYGTWQDIEAEILSAERAAREACDAEWESAVLAGLAVAAVTGQDERDCILRARKETP